MQNWSIVSYLYHQVLTICLVPVHLCQYLYYTCIISADISWADSGIYEVSEGVNNFFAKYPSEIVNDRVKDDFTYERNLKDMCMLPNA
jgi:hypothetical protein